MRETAKNSEETTLRAFRRAGLIWSLPCRTVPAAQRRGVNPRRPTPVAPRWYHGHGREAAVAQGERQPERDRPSPGSTPWLGSSPVAHTSVYLHSFDTALALAEADPIGKGRRTGRRQLAVAVGAAGRSAMRSIATRSLGAVKIFAAVHCEVPMWVNSSWPKAIPDAGRELMEVHETLWRRTGRGPITSGTVRATDRLIAVIPGASSARRGSAVARAHTVITLMRYIRRRGGRECGGVATTLEVAAGRAYADREDDESGPRHLRHGLLQHPRKNGHQRAKRWVQKQETGLLRSSAQAQPRT